RLPATGLGRTGPSVPRLVAPPRPDAADRGPLLGPGPDQRPERSARAGRPALRAQGLPGWVFAPPPRLRGGTAVGTARPALRRRDAALAGRASGPGGSRLCRPRPAGGPRSGPGSRAAPRRRPAGRLVRRGRPVRPPARPAAGAGGGRKFLLQQSAKPGN